MSVVLYAVACAKGAVMTDSELRLAIAKYLDGTGSVDTLPAVTAAESRTKFCRLLVEELDKRKLLPVVVGGQMIYGYTDFNWLVFRRPWHHEAMDFNMIVQTCLLCKHNIVVSVESVFRGGRKLATPHRFPHTPHTIEMLARDFSDYNRQVYPLVGLCEPCQGVGCSVCGRLPSPRKLQPRRIRMLAEGGVCEICGGSDLGAVTLPPGLAKGLRK